MSSPLEIIILGGGTAGWMAANLMAKSWQEKVSIRVIESPQIGIIGVGEGSTPTLKRFFADLGIPETDWMPACNATYKLNIRFKDWSPKSGRHSYSHPFISQTDIFTQRPFQVNCYTRRLGLDVNTHPGEFLLNGVLADQRKAAIAPANFPFDMVYGYHFDSGLLGEFLADHARGQGVERIKTRIESVNLNEQGEIDSLVDDQGAIFNAQFFIDCSGFAAKLIGDTLAVPFDSFAGNLFNNAAVVLPSESVKNPPVETVSHALSNGWMWTIPLTNRFGNGYVYSTHHLNPDAAETELRTRLGLLDAAENARHLTMQVGQRQRHWEKNCLALGLSQGFIEPLEATALHLVQVAIEEFIELFEKGDFTARHRSQFNQFISERFSRVRDYIVGHYKLNTREDTDYWRDNRDNKQISDELAQLLLSWENEGDISTLIHELGIGDHFNTTSWHCLFAGYGAFPPLAENQPGRGDMYVEHNIEKMLQGCALNFPSHQDALAALADHGK